MLMASDERRMTVRPLAFIDGDADNLRPGNLLGPPSAQLQPEGRQGNSGIARSEALAVLPRRVNSMVRAVRGGCRECYDDGAFRLKGRPSEAAGLCLCPKDRRDRRLQGRSADLRACRVSQAVELVEAHGAFFIR